MARITVSISLDYEYNAELRTYVEIPDRDLTRAMQKLDHYEPKAPAEYQLICTDKITVDRTKVWREEAADLISDAVHQSLLRMFRENDTVMGYSPKDYYNR